MIGFDVNMRRIMVCEYLLLLLHAWWKMKNFKNVKSFLHATVNEHLQDEDPVKCQQTHCKTRNRK